MKIIIIMLVTLATISGRNVINNNSIVPSINIESTVYLGDYVVTQKKGIKGTFLYFPEITWQVYGGKLKIYKGYYHQVYDNWVHVDSGTGAVFNGHNNHWYKIKYNLRTCEYEGLKLVQRGLRKQPIRIYKDTLIHSTQGLTKSLVYNGKKGTVLSFMYKEFYSDITRADFFTSFEFDMSEDEEQLVVYKGLIIKILKYSQSSITYKVIRKFN